MSLREYDPLRRAPKTGFRSVMANGARTLWRARPQTLWLQHISSFSEPETLASKHRLGITDRNRRSRGIAWSRCTKVSDLHGNFFWGILFWPGERVFLSEGAFWILSFLFGHPKPCKKNLRWYLFSLLKAMAAMHIPRWKHVLKTPFVNSTL